MSSNITEHSTSGTYFIFCILLIVTGVWFPSWFMWIVWAFVACIAMKVVLFVIGLIMVVIIVRKIRTWGEP